MTALITFELLRRLKQLSTWVYAALLFAGGALAMAGNAGAFSGFSAGVGSERIFANGPTSVFANQNLLALLGLFMVAAVFGQAGAQDFTTRTWPLIFTTRVRPRPYLAGRFLGAWIFSGLLFLAIPAGQLFAALAVSLLKTQHQLGPHRLDVYLWAWLVGVLPMLLVAGALFFSLAALTRQLAPVYVGVVVLVLGYLVLSSAVGNVENQRLGALADPFGFITFDVVTRYWTPVERNSQLLPLSGLMLANRVLWLGVAAAGLGLTARRFRVTVDEHRGTPANAEPPPPRAPATPAPPSGRPAWLRTALSAGLLHFRDVLRSPVYWAFVCAGLLFVLLGIVVAKQIFGTATLPVTWQVLELAQGTFSFFSLITITVYAGELVWKERDA